MCKAEVWAFQKNLHLDSMHSCRWVFVVWSDLALMWPLPARDCHAVRIMSGGKCIRCSAIPLDVNLSIFKFLSASTGNSWFSVVGENTRNGFGCCPQTGLVPELCSHVLFFFQYGVLFFPDLSTKSYKRIYSKFSKHFVDCLFRAFEYKVFESTFHKFCCS